MSLNKKTQIKHDSVRWGCRIHDCISAEGLNTSSNESPVYDTKHSDSEASLL